MSYDPKGILMPYLVKDVEPEALDTLFKVLRKTGLAAEKAAKEVLQALYLVGDRLERR